MLLVENATITEPPPALPAGSVRETPPLGCEMMNWSRGFSDAAPSQRDLSVVVNIPSKDALLAEIEGRLQAEQGFTVATLNLDHVVKLRRDAEFRAAYARHSHVVADGNPIVWISRLAGQKMQLAPGSELVEPVATIAARHGVPVALLGSTESVLSRTADALVEQHPGLQVAACISPPMGFDPTGPAAEAAVAEIAASGARLCLLALGAPRQEIFAVYAHHRLPQTGFLSIGAGLDFIAGAQSRAPAWVRALAAEWFWRLASQPRRLTGRYARCIAVLPGLVLLALQSRATTLAGKTPQ